MIQTNTPMLFYVHLEVIDIARCCHDINLDNPEEKMDITAIDLKMTQYLVHIFMM